MKNTKTIPERWKELAKEGLESLKKKITYLVKTMLKYVISYLNKYFF